MATLADIVGQVGAVHAGHHSVRQHDVEPVGILSLARTDAIALECLPPVRHRRPLHQALRNEADMDAACARFAAAPPRRHFASLHSKGTTSPMQDEMLDFDGLSEVIGTPEPMARGQRYAA